METGPWEQYQSNSTASGPWDNYAPAPGKGPADAAKNLDFERGPNYPNAKMTDATPNDLMMVQGIGGIAKELPSLIGSGLKALPLTENLVPTIERTADNQLLKSLGGSAAQVRQMGPRAARDAAEVGRKAGLDNIFSTQMGREQSLNALDEGTGKAIGDLREAASKASTAPSPADMGKTIKEQLLEKFTKPEFSGETGQLGKLTDDLAVPANPTYSDYAKRATDLNNYATGEKLKQPVNAITDVAHALSGQNDANIVQTLGADQGKTYLDKLHDLAALKKLEPFMQRGETREMAGRGGGGFMNLLQSVADKGGYRLTSKTANALHSLLNAAPSVPGKSALEITPQMAQWIKAQTEKE